MSRGVIFDFNGTMFFDQEIQERSWREYLKNLLERDISDEEFRMYIHGRNAVDTFRYFLQRDLAEEEVEALEEGKEVIYRKMCTEMEHFELAPGLTTLLDELKRRGIPITIATASAKNNVDFFFENLSLDTWFDREKVVYNDGTLPGKPEPDIYLKAAARMEVDPEDTIIFEDSASGLEAARRAGADRIVLVGTEGEADMKISDYCDTEKILALIENS